MNCLFCQIARGEKASRVVYEDDATLAFLDHRPLFHGHTLLIPKAHYETLPELPAALLAPLFHKAQLLAWAMEAALGAEGSFLAINNKVSQSVPHLHVHVVPRRRKDGLKGFFWPRQPYESPQQMEQVCNLLKAALDKLRQ